MTRRSAIVQAVERVRPAVVNIHSERTAQGHPVDDLTPTMPSQNRANGMGTGIIIDPRGYIVTNHHVIEDVSLLRVRLNDGSVYHARVVAREREYDLALLKIDADRSLPTIPVGTSSDLMVGETVVAIGNAYGYEHTVTVGVISALNRDVSLNKEISYRSLIQTDASINPGNSGGPLLNIDGELVGVNVAIRAGAQGIGFAIPVDQMVQVMTEVLAKKRRLETWPGLVCKALPDPRNSPPWYLQVEQVEPASPASKAGLKTGDVLVRLGDVEAHTSLDFERALLNLKPGDQIPVQVRRGDTVHQAQLVLMPARSLASPTDSAWKILGMRLIVVGVEEVKSGGSTLRGGLLVAELRPDGPAAKAGVQRGDIMVGLHQWETVNLDNVAYVLQHQELATFYPLKVFLLRNGQIHRGWLGQPD
jgi:serine protease Do